MNIFYLDRDPTKCARYHNDKHVVKMILEYCQLLSTAHRVLDGETVEGISKAGRKQIIWKLKDNREEILYKATHINHPSAVWVRDSSANYLWLHKLLEELCKEYTYRYEKTHKCERDGLVELLGYAPANIGISTKFNPPTPAMPDECLKLTSLESYINYYNTAKAALGKWTKRKAPPWFGKGVL
jgi:hypothetical protein